MTHLKTPLAALAGLAIAGAASAAPLTIHVDGIEARGGVLYVGVQTEAQFMKHDGIAGDVVAAPAAGSRSFTFDLPEGAYSVSIWHDFNANNQFDLSEDGPPLDGWAMINGDAMRAAPTFGEASLTLPAGGVAATLNVKYPD